MKVARAALSVLLSVAMVVGNVPVAYAGETSDTTGAADAQAVPATSATSGSAATTLGSQDAAVTSATTAASSPVATSAATTPAAPAAEPVPVSIRIGKVAREGETPSEAGLPVDASGALLLSGDGWSYDVKAGTLTLSAGYAFSLSGEACTCGVVNHGVIRAGDFGGTVTVAADGSIEGGTFEGALDDSAGGTVKADGAVLLGVENSLEGLTSDNPVATVAAGSVYSETLAAAAGGALPETLSVTLDGKAAEAGADYSWDAATGELSVSAATGEKLGPICVAAKASPTAALSAQSVDPQATAGTINVAGKSSIIIFADHYVVDSVYYTSWSGDVTLTGTGDCTVTLNIGTGETAKKVILSNLTLSGDNSTIACAYDGARIWLAKGTTNTVSSTKKGIPAINSGSSSVVIGGEGELNASGPSYAAAIGRGQYAEGSSRITIEGGTVNATGGYEAAGIGGGDSNSGDMTVTISGGTVSATGGNGGAGIGAGYEASGSTTVNVTGGTISDVTSVKYGAGIGGGQYLTGPVTVNISGGTIGWYSGEDYKDHGPIGGYEAAGIGGGDSSESTTTVDISGGSIAYALGGDGGAGIGAGYKASGTITVRMTGGNVGGRQIQGGEYGAAIGGGQYVKGDVQIDLTGGAVESALGGYEGAGIGGGDSSSDGALNISIGGTFSTTTKVVGGAYAAGIGGGYKGRIDRISFGGSCNVQGVSSACGSAGIGTGIKGTGEPTSNKVTIEISGGTVWSTSVKGAVPSSGAPMEGSPAIGVGGYSSCATDIVISGGDITAQSDCPDSPAIGLSGLAESSARMGITITGGKVVATATADKASAIGSGDNSASTAINISGGTVIAEGTKAGIGGYFCDIAISGGNVTGDGRTLCGIGSYAYGGADTIDISGGTVTGKGNYREASASGIGTQSDTVSISGGTVEAIGGTGKPGITSELGNVRKNVVSISGGQVHAVGGKGASGIGIDPSLDNYCTLKISGGTVRVEGAAGYPAINCGTKNVFLPLEPAVTITGGNVMAVNGTGYAGQEVIPTPTNGDAGTGEPVARTLLTVPLASASSAEQRVTTLSYALDDSSTYSYGTNDVYTLNGGQVYAYLPLHQNAVYDFYTATANTEDRVNAHLSPLNYTLRPVSVGASAFQNYVFDSNKLTPAAKDFTFTVDGESGSPTHAGGDTATIPYDGAMHTAEVSLADGVKGMGSIVVKYKAEGSDTYVYTPPENAGTYGVYVDLGNGASYDAVRNLQVGTITIEAMENPVTVTGYTGVYDGQEHTVTASALPGSTFSYSTDGGKNWSETAPTFEKPSDSCTVSVKATNPNCKDGSGSATVAISKRSITITASSATVAYNGTEQSVFSGTYAGVISGDWVVDGKDASGNTYDDAHAMPYECKGTDVGDYQGGLVNDPEGTANPRDGKMHLAVRTAATKEAAKTSTVDVTDCYAITLVNGKLTITKALVTVTADNKSKAVGAADPALTATITGLVNGESTSLIKYGITRAEGETADIYTITPDGEVSQGNYKVAYKPGTLTIAASGDNVVTVTGYSGLYDGKSHKISASASLGGTLYYSKTGGSAALDWTETVPTYTNVSDSATVYVKAELAGKEDAYGQAEVTIDPDPIAADVNAATQTWTGQALTPATVSYQEGTKTITLTEGTDYDITYADNVDVGTATCSVVLKGNYEGSTTAHFAIRPLQVTEPTVATDLVYTGREQSCVSVPTGARYTVTGNTATDAGTYTATATLNDKANTTWADGTTADKTYAWTIAKATDNTVSASDYAGTYDGAAHGITVDTSATKAGSTVYYSTDNASWLPESPTWTNATAAQTVYVKAVNPNYDDAKGSAKVTINKAPLTATYAGETVGYGDTPAYAVTVTGFVKDETAGSATGYTAPTISGGPTIPAAIGTYPLTPSGGTATNYAFTTYNFGTLTVTAKTVQLSDVTGGSEVMTYTGSPITLGKDDVEIYVGGNKLTYGTDYDISDYKDNTNAGTGSYTLTFKGNYSGTVVGYPGLFIMPADASDATVSGAVDKPFTGSPIEQVLAVVFGGKTLTAGTDYEVKYQDNVEAGTASYTIGYWGNYAGTTTGTFHITPADASALTILPVADQTYTGSAIVPDLIVLAPDGVTILEKGTDYDVAFTDNVNAGTATARLTFKGDFAGTKVCTFKITPADASGAAVSGVGASYAYTGSAITPAPTVTLNGRALVAGTDYDVTYSSNVRPGTAGYVIAFKGNYAGTATGTFAIAPVREATLVDRTGTGIRQAGLGQALAAAALADPSAASIVVDLRVSVADPSGAAALAIRALPAASGLAFDRFWDAVLTKTVDGVTTDIGSANDALVAVTYPFDFSGKGEVRVFACHAGSAYELAATPNAYGEYAALDRAAGTVTVFAKRYSTFGVGYAGAAASGGPAADSGTVGPAPAASGTAATGDPSSSAAPAALALAGLAALALAARRRRSL